MKNTQPRGYGALNQHDPDTILHDTNAQTPKIIVVGPKLIFSFTVAQRLISFLERSWDTDARALSLAQKKSATS